MKSLFPLLILAFIFTGCQKSGNENAPQPEAKKTEVTFAIADFEQSVRGFATANTKSTMAVGDTLSNYADMLVYSIYNADGSFLKNATQNKTDANFGRITEQLAPGNYSIVIGAGKGVVSLFANTGTTFETALINAPAPYTWVDVFTKTVGFTVGGNPLTQSIRLDRLVGALDVVLTDEMPASVNRIAVTLNNEAYNSLFKTGLATTYGATTRSFTISASDVGTRNKKLSIIVGNTTSDLNIVLQAFDSANNKLAEKAITTRINKNQRTTLTGSLIGPAATGFTVVVNPVWNASGTVINF